MRHGLLCVAALVLQPVLAFAQQRPLVTEDPETIGAGRLLVEGGLDYGRSVSYPASGLEGHLLRFPLIGVSVGLSSIAEIQIDGGLHNHLSITSREPAPLSDMVTATGDSTSSVEDIVIGTKIRIAAETESRPAFGLRFATKLPNASNESGLGLDTTDFFASILVAKTVQSVRVVGNVGLGILGDPDPRRSAERRVDLRCLVRAGVDAAGRGRRRNQRSRQTRGAASRRPAPSRGVSRGSAAATPSGAGGQTPPCCSA